MQHSDANVFLFFLRNEAKHETWAACLRIGHQGEPQKGTDILLQAALWEPGV